MKVIIVFIAIAIAALVLITFGSQALAKGGALQMHPGGCELLSRNTVNDSIENQNVCVADTDNANVAALGVVITVPAAMTDLGWAHPMAVVAIRRSQWPGIHRLDIPASVEPRNKHCRTRRLIDGGVHINNMAKIILRPAPAIAPRGPQSGTFIGARQEAGTDAVGVELNRVIADVQLEAQDAKKQPYVVSKTYNLVGHGFSAFCEDFKSWAGRSLTQDEIEGFDPDVLIKGQKVIAKIDHRKDGKNLVAVIKGFAPATVATQATA